MGPPPKKTPLSQRPVKWEDKEVIEKLNKGEYVPVHVYQEVNDKRAAEGLPAFIAHVRDFENDKNELDKLRSEALSDFLYLRERNESFLNGLASENQEVVARGVEQINTSLGMVNEKTTEEVYKELGQWFADYIKDSGYYAHASPVLLKQMILSAFPVIMKEKEFTTDNLEQFLANSLQVYSQYIRIREGEGNTIGRVLSLNPHQRWG
mmetsp:Transcript_7183/g.14739  ORF Transcript_7183/g.14739 Transcript_7183/m.14739 type:complete len:208 (+) Transcript_7183:1383-2006(+)